MSFKQMLLATSMAAAALLNPSAAKHTERYEPSLTKAERETRQRVAQEAIEKAEARRKRRAQRNLDNLDNLDNL